MRPTVNCSVHYIDLENEEGREVESVEVVCGDCGDAAQSYGTSDRSVRRCLLLLAQNCAFDNWYEAE